MRARQRLIGSGSEIGSSPNDDLGLSQRHFVRPGYPLFARTARQGQVALGARRGSGIREPVPVICGPSLCNGRCPMLQRSPAVPPLGMLLAAPNFPFSCGTRLRHNVFPARQAAAFVGSALTDSLP